MLTLDLHIAERLYGLPRDANRNEKKAEKQKRPHGFR